MCQADGVCSESSEDVMNLMSPIVIDPEPDSAVYNAETPGSRTNTALNTSPLQAVMFMEN